MKRVFTYLFATVCTCTAQAAEIAGWGKTNNNSVGEAWGTTARGYTMQEVTIDGEYVETGMCVIDTSATKISNCKSKSGSAECGFVDSDGCVYDKAEVVNRVDYQLNLATDTLFQEVLNDLEKEAQAKYNAKITAEQNMCVNANAGGIMGRNDMTSTYMWVKLTKKKIPAGYATAGLTTKDFTASNDLYGSFCRARITLQSDDADIQAAIRDGADWATAYFAVGDVFTCGSWIPQTKLEDIAQKVATKKLEAQGKDDIKGGKLSTSQKWWLAGSTVLAMGVGGAGADLLQTKTGLGGLLGTTNRKSAVEGTENINAVEESLGLAENIYYGQCKEKYSSYTKVLTREHNKSVVGAGQLYTFEWKGGADGDFKCQEGVTCTHSCADLHSYITDLRKALNIDSKGVEKDGKGGRVAVDLLTAGATGLATNLIVREAMRDANKAEYDKAEREAMQEFMSSVGSHIFCFIGAEEAGTFGDLVELSLE